MAKKNVEAAAVLDQVQDAGRRKGADRRKQAAPVAVERRAGERREKVSRRRQIDPTTCERDYSDDEVAFMNALDQYKRKNGRMFPTCSEILEVIRDLGYVKPLAAMSVLHPEASPDVPGLPSSDNDDE
jgi:hypothetical protein